MLYGGAEKYNDKINVLLLTDVLRQPRQTIYWLTHNKATVEPQCSLMEPQWNDCNFSPTVIPLSIAEKHKELLSKIYLAAGIALARSRM